MKLFLLGTLLVVALQCAYAADYCAANLFPGQGKHIACNNNNKFAATCPSDARDVDLSKYITIILQSHNEKRNQIAGGGLNGFDAANHMATMQWDQELADIAALNVKQCAMRHDSCRSTTNFKYAGQNLAIMGYSGPVGGFSDETIIKRQIDSWWSENKDATKAQLAKYPSSYSGPAIGHFTVMAADHNTRVGCAASRYTQGGWNYLLFACNYATTNIVNQPIYIAGQTASACKTGTNPNYKNLCSTAEVYKNN